MPRIPLNILQKERKGTMQELAKKPAKFSAYNTNTEMVDTTIYPQNLVSTAIAGGTEVTQVSGQPSSPNAYSLFSFDRQLNSQPLVVSGSQSYPQITAIAAGDGRKYSGATFGFDFNDYISLPLYPSVAMAVTVKIDDGTTANLSYTTGTLKANQWNIVRIPIAKMTKTGAFVYTVGTKNFSYTLGAVGTLAVYEASFANNDQCFVGSEIRETFDCYLDWNEENKRKIEKLMCFNYVDGTINTEQEMSFKVKTARTSYQIEALLEGQILRNGLAPIRKDVVCPAIASNTIPAGTFPALLETSAIQLTINGVDLVSVFSADQLVDGGQFLYNAPTGAITFATGVLNGVIPQGSYMTKEQGTYYSVQNLGNSVFGQFEFGRDATKKETVIAYKTQIVDVKKKQAKGQVEYEIEFMVLPVDVVENGRLNKRLTTTVIR